MVPARDSRRFKGLRPERKEQNDSSGRTTKIANRETAADPLQRQRSPILTDRHTNVDTETVNLIQENTEK